MWHARSFRASSGSLAARSSSSCSPAPVGLLPPEWSPERGEPLTLREVITRIVLQEVESFRQRQQQRRLVRILTEQQIEEGLAKGRVEAGGSNLDQRVDPEIAVATALQAFEDGIYLVILDGEEQRDLDREVNVHAGSHLVFVRLTLLAGA